MRIVIDLQGIQSASRYRGIGRYTYSLISSMLPLLKQEDVWVILNENFLETLEETRKELEKFLPSYKIVHYKTPTPINQAYEKNIKKQMSQSLSKSSLSLCFHLTYSL